MAGNSKLKGLAQTERERDIYIYMDIEMDKDKLAGSKN